MAREKKRVHKVQMTEGKGKIIRQLLEEYEIGSAKDIHEALKDLMGGTIKEVMEAEMDSHLGYVKSERTEMATKPKESTVVVEVWKYRYRRTGNPA